MPRWTPSASLSIAAGWSPVASNGATSLKSGTVGAYARPRQDVSGTDLPAGRMGVAPALVHLPPRFADGTRRIDPPRRDGFDPVAQVALRGDPPLGIVVRDAPVAEAPALHSRITGDQPDL